MNCNILKKSSLSAVAVCAALGVSQMAHAGPVTLVSGDGTVNMTGEFVDYSDNAYTIRTALGDLRISASRVRCEGESCPVLETASADVQILGSDTVGTGLMPLLLEGYAGYLSAAASVSSTQTSGETLAEFVGDDGYGDDLASFLVTSTGSSDAFTALLSGDIDIGMSARRISPDEARGLRDSGAGNMIDPSQEHIIAVDSLVVITNPENPVQSLTMAQLAAIYSGNIRNWSDVGGPDERITVMHRREDSGTRGVFLDRVFGDADNSIQWKIFADDNNQMAALVNGDPWAIGYVGYAFQRGANALTLVNECGINMTPDAFSARTEEYALQRRLYLYNRSDATGSDTQEFLQFATSDAADSVIGKAGFIGLGVDRRQQSLSDSRAQSLANADVDAYEAGFMQQMLRQMVDYDRLSTTFRFRTGSANLDERGVMDMERLANYLQTQGPGTEVLIVGFTDSVGQFDSNRVLSEDRAAQVTQQLRNIAGDRLSNISVSSVGYGEIAPSSCNVNEDGRRINRRVEVWIRSAA